ncbi:hypothetical protein [Streptomyces sp. NPDC002758]
MAPPSMRVLSAPPVDDVCSSRLPSASYRYLLVRSVVPEGVETVAVRPSASYVNVCVWPAGSAPAVIVDHVWPLPPQVAAE